jgi:topoisomerase-4 subunit A
VARRIGYRLERIEQRLHVLAGLLVAYLNLDEVIRIVREEDHPRDALMSAFKLSEIQANAILDLRLRHLARLEEQKITAERGALEGEKLDLEKILKSKARMKTLLKKELLEDAEKFGDERRSPLSDVEEASAYAEQDLVSNDPVTVVLSTKGWVRSARGHEAEPRELNYRSGDEFLSAARGRSNDPLVFIDSGGRAYSVAAHTLPSSRGQGEPLTGRLNSPEGARFVGVVMGPGTSRLVLASNAGYGFVTTLATLLTKNRAGKAALSVPKGGVALPPATVGDGDEPLVVAVTSQGRMLAFPLADVPELSRGKGNKLINIPSAAFKSGEETVVGVAVIYESDRLLVVAGQRHLSLKRKDLEHYIGERARRGRKLPRGFQKVDGFEVESG